jgi:hypothetical protein
MFRAHSLICLGIFFVSSQTRSFTPILSFYRKKENVPSPVYTEDLFSAILYKRMDVAINPRGNGACPLCEQNDACRIQGSLSQAMEGFSAQDDPIEVVVYSCPQFEEKL